MKPVKVLLLYAKSAGNSTLSYQHGWPRQFAQHPAFDCISINLKDQRLAARLRRRIATRVLRFDAIVLLHSVYSNSCLLRGWLLDAICAASQPKALFLGNEYKLMPEKMEFCDSLGVGLLVSQSSFPPIHELYRERLGCSVIGMPNGGLDQSLFYPTIPLTQRPTDIGFRAHESPLYLGHDDKRRLAGYVLKHSTSYGLTVDISLDPNARYSEHGWADFLNRCKAQLGAEAGGNYFELTDKTRKLVNNHLGENPNTSWEEIFRVFFKHYQNPIDGRMIASRHIEAAGTKTVQILFEGHYNGYLEPDVHYIPLKNDFSNFDQVVQKFRDETYCRAIVENAYELAVQELTYQKLIDKLYESLQALL